MKTIFALTAAALTLTSALPAYADDAPQTTQPMPLYASLDDSTVNSPLPAFQSALPRSAEIAVARLDGGRFVHTPKGELQDWTFLSRRIDHTLTQLGDTAEIAYVPEISENGTSPDNKIDEIRLKAVGAGFDYVLLYGVGPDANWASFGGKALSETGLTVKPDCAAWEAAKAKALLVDAYSGHVLGAVTADNIEFNIGELADRAQVMIEGLTRMDDMAAADGAVSEL